MGSQTHPRLREHPSKRFVVPEHCLNLDTESQKLDREAHPPINGHGQEAIYKQGPITLVIFTFEPGGFLKEHVVPDGAVSIHVIEGELTIKTPASERRLRQNDILLLAPGVKHDVSAINRSRLLVTVHLEGNEGAGSP
ncbi:MAG TPA: hypothetical protein VFJ58_00800 [Armatimonadota bacterium]|nr:hypothetical protein [Armatimonadota bacterium]